MVNGVSKDKKSVAQSSIDLPILITKEGDMFVASVPIFNIATQGKTVEETMLNLKDAIELYFEGEDVNGILEERLPMPKISFEFARFDIPTNKVTEMPFIS